MKAFKDCKTFYDYYGDGSLERMQAFDEYIVDLSNNGDKTQAIISLRFVLSEIWQRNESLKRVMGNNNMGKGNESTH